MSGLAEERNNDGRYVIFCADGRDYGQPGYIFFTHEADVMMIAAASEVESGKLTPAEAREILEPYREVLLPLYTDEQSMIFDSDRRSWRDLDSFPTADEVQQSPQASQIFWYEADELGIKGVTLVWSTPFPVLAPVSKKVLEELKKAVSDEYEIVVKNDIEEFDATGKSVEWAKKLIEEAATTEISQQSQLLSDTAIFERADLVRQALNDPAFVAGRYIDDDIENLRVGDLVRIYLVDTEEEADLLNAAGPVTSVNGDQYSVYLDEGVFLFRRDQIELMPTGFNPHYGDK